MANASIYGSLLDSVSRCFTVETAQALVDLRTEAAFQKRIEDLAIKANEGEMTDDEREEYETYVRTIDFIAILQAKARLQLRQLAA